MVDAFTSELNNKHSDLLCADDLLKYDGKEPLDPENRFFDINFIYVVTRYISLNKADIFADVSCAGSSIIETILLILDSFIKEYLSDCSRENNKLVKAPNSTAALKALISKVEDIVKSEGSLESKINVICQMDELVTYFNSFITDKEDFLRIKEIFLTLLIFKYIIISPNN